LPDQHITTAGHPKKENAAMKVNEAQEYLIHFIYTQVPYLTEYRISNKVEKQEGTISFLG
jgi:hypothetical protein